MDELQNKKIESCLLKSKQVYNLSIGNAYTDETKQTLKTKVMTEKSICLVDNHYGVYIAAIFAKNYADCIVNKAELQESLNDLKTVESEFYWESWEDVLDNAKLLIDGELYYLHQDDDLWAIPEGETVNDD